MVFEYTLSARVLGSRIAVFVAKEAKKQKDAGKSAKEVFEASYEKGAEEMAKKMKSVPL